VTLWNEKGEKLRLQSVDARELLARGLGSFEPPAEKPVDMVIKAVSPKVAEPPKSKDKQPESKTSGAK
jgi:hypothetical protein